MPVNEDKSEHILIAKVVKVLEVINDLNYHDQIRVMTSAMALKGFKTDAKK